MSKLEDLTVGQASDGVWTKEAIATAEFDPLNVPPDWWLPEYADDQIMVAMAKRGCVASDALQIIWRRLEEARLVLRTLEAAAARTVMPEQGMH